MAAPKKATGTNRVTVTASAPPGRQVKKIKATIEPTGGDGKADRPATKACRNCGARMKVGGVCPKCGAR